GFHRAAGRSLPHPADPYAGGHTDCTNGGTRIATQRGFGRGDRAGARPWARAIRPRWRIGDLARPASLVPPQRAEPARRRDTREGWTGTEPDVCGARGHLFALQGPPRYYGHRLGRGQHP